MAVLTFCPYEQTHQIGAVGSCWLEKLPGLPEMFNSAKYNHFSDRIMCHLLLGETWQVQKVGYYIGTGMNRCATGCTTGFCYVFIGLPMSKTLHKQTTACQYYFSQNDVYMCVFFCGWKLVCIASNLDGRIESIAVILTYVYLYSMLIITAKSLPTHCSRYDTLNEFASRPSRTTITTNQCWHHRLPSLK